MLQIECAKSESLDKKKDNKQNQAPSWMRSKEKASEQPSTLFNKNAETNNSLGKTIEVTNKIDFVKDKTPEGDKRKTTHVEILETSRESPITVENSSFDFVLSKTKEKNNTVDQPPSSCIKQKKEVEAPNKLKKGSALKATNDATKETKKTVTEESNPFKKEVRNKVVPVSSSTTEQKKCVDPLKNLKEKKALKTIADSVSKPTGAETVKVNLSEKNKLFVPASSKTKNETVDPLKKLKEKKALKTSKADENTFNEQKTENAPRSGYPANTRADVTNSNKTELANSINPKAPADSINKLLSGSNKSQPSKQANISSNKCITTGKHEHTPASPKIAAALINIKETNQEKTTTEEENPVMTNANANVGIQEVTNRVSITCVEDEAVTRETTTKTEVQCVETAATEPEEEEDASGMRAMRKEMDTKMENMEAEFAAGASKLAALRARMKRIRETAKANAEADAREEAERRKV